MVKSKTQLLLALVAVVVLAGALAPSSYAATGQNPAPPANSGPTGGAAGSGGLSSSSSSNDSAGAPQHTTVRSCSLYATSSSFGLSCVTPGGGGGDAELVRQILAGDAASFCWDTQISDADLASKYAYEPTAGEQAYVESCITGLNPGASLFDQPDVQLNQQVIELPVGALPCPVIKPAAKKAKKGKTVVAPPPVTPPLPVACVKTLTSHQQTIVAGTAGKDAQIPGITLTTQPSTVVRTNEAVAFVDAATDANGDRITRTPDYTVGGVTLWAVMDSFSIHPYGPGQSPSIPCEGTAQVTAADSQASMPKACWWTYDQSSAAQPGLTYPFRAEADWTVYYSSGGARKTLASFKKYDDLKLPVDDIQTRVIN